MAQTGRPNVLTEYPWITPTAADFLERIISKQWVCLEFGAGGSTLYLAAHTRKVVSVEGRPSWYRRIRKKLPANVDLRLAPDPDSYLVPAAEQAWDFIFLDGFWRVQCFQAAWSRLKVGGWLLLDNANRRKYRPIHAALKLHEHIATTQPVGIEASSSPGHVWRTDFWRKRHV